MKKTLGILLALIIALACTASFAEEAALIGLCYMETGSLAAGGKHMKQAVVMAFEEINAKGGVLGTTQLDLYMVDDGSAPTGSVTAVNNILSHDVVMSIGPHNSPCTLAAMGYYAEAGIPFISGATSPSVAQQGNEYFFRVSVSDAAVAQVMVKFAQERFSAKKVAAIYITDDYGKAANNAAQAYSESVGLEYYSEGMTADDTDVTGQLLKIKNWEPDVLLSFTHDADSVLAIRQYSELGMRDIPFVGPNALPQPYNLELLTGEQVEGLYASTDYYPDQDDPVMVDFIARYADRWGEEPDRAAALYYCAAYLAADAINRAGSLDSTAIRDALATTKNFSCILGNLTANEYGELNSTLFILAFDGEKNMTVAEKVSLN